MSTLKAVLLCCALGWLSGCASGAGRLPYDSWWLGLGAPNYMEVWIETADVVDVQERVFRRAMSGVAGSSPKNLKGDPRGWPERPGSGASKQVLGADLPRLIYVRWQSLAEPQTYEVFIVIPEAIQQAMLKGEKTYCKADGKWITGYHDGFTVGLAPGGIAKVWLNGACLKPIDVARVQGEVVKLGPDSGRSGGEYALPLKPAAKAYIEKYGIPYGSW
jgi:hypothetical protein